MECRGTDACGAICGADCDYACRSAGSCGARVGGGANVVCQDVGSCVVECEGNCHVTCTRVGGPGCAITCLGGGAPSNCGGDLKACGPC